MVKFFSIFILVTILVITAGCSPQVPAASQPAGPSATGAGQPALPTTTPPPLPTAVLSTAAPTLIPTTPLATVEKSSGSLWVKITSPLDNSVVNSAEIDVVGSAPVDTVLSINDEIIDVGSDQKFSAHLTLDEGINVIEVLASDISGNEVFIPLTVYFDK